MRVGGKQQGALNEFCHDDLKAGKEAEASIESPVHRVWVIST